MKMSMKRAFAWAAIVTLAAGCADEDALSNESCTVTDQNTWLKDTMQEWYLENEQLPDLDPAAYSSSDDFLRALVEDVDLAPNSPVEGRDRFTIILEESVEQDFINNITTGFGVLVTPERDPSNEYRGLLILDVFGTFEGETESPASRAGLRRGDVMETLDGEDLFSVFERLVGAAFTLRIDDDATYELSVRRQDGTRETLMLTAEEVRPTSVPLFKTFDVDGEEVGYLLFRDFDFASVEGLREAFAFFADRQVTKLIIDQRYNLGGFVFIIDFLANLLKGEDLGADGTTVYRRETWNSLQASARNFEAAFESPECPQFVSSLDEFECTEPAVGLTGLTQLVFINSGNTASASEIIVNSMKPHLDVKVVGSRSVGKPVGSAGFPGFAGGNSSFCGLVLRPTILRNVNGLGEGDFFDGLVPDCPADDDASVPLGDENEASVAAALQYLRDGTCPQSGAPGGLTVVPPRRRALLNADHTFSPANSVDPFTGQAGPPDRLR